MFNIKYILSYLFIVTLIFACDKTPQSVSPNANEPNISPQQSASNNASSKSFDLIVGPSESIQTAVNQANTGDKILVDGGSHAEQILINKDLTLVGQNNATITQPQSVQSYNLAESGSSWRPLIFANGGTIQNGTASGSQTVDVTVRGFIIDGESNPESGLTGVLFRNVQSSGGIADVTVKNMDLEGSGSTFGLIAYGDSKVTFANNEINDIERGGIGANGDGGAHPSPDVIVKDNIIVGSDNPNNAPNGIQIGYGAKGKVSGNTISQIHYSGPVWSASGILIFESDNVKIQNNTVKDADRAIAISSWGWFSNTADGNSITRNTIGESDGGIVVQSKSWDNILSTMNSTSNNNKIARNTVEGTGSGIGIHVYTEDLSDSYDPAVENNKVINNQIDNFSTAIQTDGSGGNKVQANNHPFSP